MRAIQTLYAGQSVPAEQNVYVRSIDSSDNGTTWTPWEEIVSSNGSYPDMTVGTASEAAYADSAASADTAGYATTAKSDAAGNDIQTTYATKTEVNAKYTKPTSGIPESDLSQAVQTKLNSGGGGGVQNTFAFSVSIPTSKWSNNTATLTSSDNADMAQITADSFVLFMAGDGSSQAFVQSNVRVTAQGAGTLTLSCDTAPTANLTAAVVIIN